MSFVAVAIGGGVAAGAGAGASIYGGMQQSKAAKRSSNAMQDAFNQSIATQQAGKREALGYLDPVRQMGLNAGSTLESLLYSPGQRQAQAANQTALYQGEIDKLTAQNLTFDQWRAEHGAQYTGGKGMKRSRSAYAAYSSDINNRIRDAQSNLTNYQKQAQVQQQTAGQANDIQASPWYQFQASLFNRNEDRANSARGLTGSGFEAEARRMGMLQLGAQETESQFGRLFNMLGLGANASTVGAGVITGTAQNVGQAQQGIGQAQAAGYQGVAQANANMAAGVSNAVGGAIGAGLNAYQFQSLINANKPQPAATPVGNPAPAWRSGYEKGFPSAAESGGGWTSGYQNGFPG